MRMASEITRRFKAFRFLVVFDTKRNRNGYQGENSEFILVEFGNGRLKNISMLNQKNTRVNVKQFV
jgi:hypothetical protein